MTDIRSAQIRDGTIVDVDIAAAAAIAFSKLKRLAVDSTATGGQNNWALGLGGGDGLVTWHGAADLAVTGLAAGVAGQIVILKNTGTKIATFAHNSGSSSAGNKLFNVATVGVTPVAPRGFIAYQYDGTQWLLVAHEQGEWITPTYSAGNFTASAGTWTVDAGDVRAYAYKLEGSKLLIQFNIGTSSVSTGGVTLRIAIPGGFTPRVATVTLMRAVDANVPSTGFAAIAASGTYIDCQTAAGTFGATAGNDTYVQTLCEIEVL